MKQKNVDLKKKKTNFQLNFIIIIFLLLFVIHKFLILHTFTYSPVMYTLSGYSRFVSRWVDIKLRAASLRTLYKAHNIILS